jgi:hypothetical protein
LKERLQAKLRSGRGASITFALLLFLVCAVIGSVVLAAGTAASGRVSQLAEADRRYYAVTSAAQLFREELDGQSFIVERTKTTTTKYSMVGLDENGEDASETGKPAVSQVEVLMPSDDPVYGFRLLDPSGDPPEDITADADKSLLAETALELVFGASAPTSSEVAGAWERAFGVDPWTRELTVYLGDTDNKKAPVGVTVKLGSDPSGASMSFTFKDQEEGNEHYSVSFTLTLMNGAVPVTDTSEVKDTTNSKYVRTETRTNRLVWAASDIRSGS